MSDIRDVLHSSLDEAEAQLISIAHIGTLWPALRLLVEAIRQRDHEIERRLSEIERRRAAEQPYLRVVLSGHDVAGTGAYDE